MAQFPEGPRHPAGHGVAVRSCVPVLSSSLGQDDQEERIALG